MVLPRISLVLPLSDGVVSLRRPHTDDIRAIAQYIIADEAQAWLSGVGDAAGLLAEYAAGWDFPDQPNRLGLTIVVTRLPDDALVGVVHLEQQGEALSVGYGIAPDHRRRGVASRALALVTAWAMAHGFASVELEIGEENAASQGVARRCGFEPTRRTRSQVTEDGSIWHARTWSVDA